MSEGERPLERERITLGTGDLILYQLTELKSEVREGFIKIEGRFERIEQRMTSQERWRERMEERDRADVAATALIDSRWLPLLGIALTAAVALLLYFLGGG